MNTPEGRQFACAMTWAPDRVALKVDGRTACGCGCGRPERIDFTLCGHTVAITDPAAVDILIRTLQDARRKLWRAP